MIFCQFTGDISLAMALPRRCQASRVFVQGEEEICIGDVATLELRMGFLVSIPGNLCQKYRKNHCFLIGKSSTLHMGHVKHGYEINDQCVIGMMPFVSEFGGKPQESKVIPMVNHHFPSVSTSKWPHWGILVYPLDEPK